MSKKPALNADQEEAFRIIKNFLASADDTLLLQGYAGTGKTFLMQHLGKWLTKREMPFSMLASTGRAATVLRGKTGFETKTVHSELYSFSKVNGVEDNMPDNAPVDAYGQMSLQFALRQPDEEKKLYIVDEASMLASETGNGLSMVSFGSGLLMKDFFAAVGNNKVIFVGDPCQLPPVGQLSSPALDLNWLNENGRHPVFVQLNKIERNADDNDILLLAAAVREMVDIEQEMSFPKLPASNINSVELYADEKELFNSYLEKYRKVGYNGTLAITRSNKKVGIINRAIRRDLYGELDLPLQPNDVLLVVQNNYAVPLANGDFCEVVSIGETRMKAGLNFLNIKLKALLSGEEYDVLLSLDILYGTENNFSQEQQRRLMIDFHDRMREKKIRPNSEQYKKKMMSDPYLNCLRAKYGYAVTGHKAQGGEWDHVFLFLDKQMYGMPRPELYRWWYTAITRTRLKLHLANAWWVG